MFCGNAFWKNIHSGEVWKKSLDALLGPFDFLDIYEAPDAETAAKVSMISLSNGALQAESWTAIPYKRFVELAVGVVTLLPFIDDHCVWHRTGHSCCRQN